MNCHITEYCPKINFWHKELARLLISNGADLTARTYDGKTALSLSEDQGYMKIAELLRKHGAKE